MSSHHRSSSPSQFMGSAFSPLASSYITRSVRSSSSLSGNSIRVLRSSAVWSRISVMSSGTLIFRLAKYGMTQNAATLSLDTFPLISANIYAPPCFRDTTIYGPSQRRRIFLFSDISTGEFCTKTRSPLLKR